jgi:SAM-dependent methyltransferase
MSWRGKLVDRLEWTYNRLTGRRLDLARAVADRLGGRQGVLVLDLGAGNGRLGVKVAELAGVKVVLCDRSEAKLRRRPPGSVAVVADGAALPFRSGAFGGAFLVDVVHHLEAPRRVLAALSRVLASHAAVIVLDYRPSSGLTRLLRVLRPVMLRDCHFRGPEDLARLAGALGLPASCVPLDAHEYVCILGQAEARMAPGQAGENPDKPSDPHAIAQDLPQG